LPHLFLGQVRRGHLLPDEGRNLLQSLALLLGGVSRLQVDFRDTLTNVPLFEKAHGLQIMNRCVALFKIGAPSIWKSFDGVMRNAFRGWKSSMPTWKPI